MIYNLDPGKLFSPRESMINAFKLTLKLTLEFHLSWVCLDFCSKIVARGI